MWRYFCWSFFLSVIRISQNVVTRFSWNWVDSLSLGQGTSDMFFTIWNGSWYFVIDSLTFGPFPHHGGVFFYLFGQFDHLAERASTKKQLHHVMILGFLSEKCLKVHKYKTFSFSLNKVLNSLKFLWNH